METKQFLREISGASNSFSWLWNAHYDHIGASKIFQTGTETTLCSLLFHDYVLIKHLWRIISYFRIISAYGRVWQNWLTFWRQKFDFHPGIHLSNVFIVRISEKYFGTSKNIFLKVIEIFPFCLKHIWLLSIVRENPLRPVLIFGNQDFFILSV